MLLSLFFITLFEPILSTIFVFGCGIFTEKPLFLISLMSSLLILFISSLLKGGSSFFVIIFSFTVSSLITSFYCVIISSSSSSCCSSIIKGSSGTISFSLKVCSLEFGNDCLFIKLGFVLAT